MIWIVVGVIVGVLMLGVLVWAIINHQINQRHREIEPGLYQEALKHVTANEPEVIELLNMKDGELFNLKGHHVNFAGDEATVYLKAEGKKKFVTLKFSLKNGEWSIDGPIKVRDA